MFSKIQLHILLLVFKLIYGSAVLAIDCHMHVQVIKENLAGPDFVWLLPGWFRANWWAAVDGTDCTAEEMSQALEHTIVISGNDILDNDPSRILASNKVCILEPTIRFSTYRLSHRTFLNLKKI